LATYLHCYPRAGVRDFDMSDAARLLELERAGIDVELDPPVIVARPQKWSTPVIFCSPHSGRVYPQPFLAMSRLAPLALRRSEDAYVDHLFATALDHGAPLLAARFPRAYLDVNREPFELDPKLIEGPLPPGANTSSARVAGGLGTVPRVVADGEDIYWGRVPATVAMLRIDRLYKPFHVALAELVAEAVQRFGVAVLVDCHSMPSASVGAAAAQRPHFVIGDRFGTSCAAEVTRTITRCLAGGGYDVQANRPYAGGFITEHYGRPQARVHAVQIEINRALYLDETKVEPRADFAGFAHVIDGLVARIASMGQSWVTPFVQRFAAE
jgi:N-formylglutamate amidohydrolase